MKQRSVTVAASEALFVGLQCFRARAIHQYRLHFNKDICCLCHRNRLVEAYRPFAKKWRAKK